MRALLVIPAFNEGVKLETTAERIRRSHASRKTKLAVDVLIVDDASTDGVPGKAARAFGFATVRNEKRQGVGFSLRKGYDYGLEKGYDILLTMAGNNKDNPEELDRLISPIAEGRADFVQGSRYVKGGDYGNMPWQRLFATRIIHPLLFSLAAGRRVTDSTNGFRAFRAAILKDARIKLHESWLDRYELEPYLFLEAVRLGYRVTEVPVTKIYPERKLGYSKVPPIIGWWSMIRPLVYVIFRIRK